MRLILVKTSLISLQKMVEANKWIDFSVTYLNSSPRFLLYFPSEQLIVGVIIIVYQFKTEKGTFPPFSKFVKFLSSEADIACNPVISSHSMKEDDNKKPNDDDGRSKHKFGY